LFMIIEIASVLWGVVSMVSWGSGDFFAKRIVGSLGYHRLMLYTQLISLAPLIVLAIVFAPPLPSSSRTIALILATGICYFLSLFSFYRGISIGKVSVIAPVASTWAVVAMAFSFVLLGETLAPSQIFCATLIIVGIIMVSMRSSSVGQSGSGILYALACVFFSGLNVIFLKLVSADIGVVGTLFYSRVVVTFILLMAIPFVGTPVRRDVCDRFPLKTVTVIGLSEFLGHLGFMVGISIGMVSIVTPVSSASPAVAVILAQIFLKEELVQIQKIAVVFVILGIVILSVLSVTL